MQTKPVKLKTTDAGGVSLAPRPCPPATTQTTALWWSPLSVSPPTSPQWPC